MNSDLLSKLNHKLWNDSVTVISPYKGHTYTILEKDLFLGEEKFCCESQGG